MSDVVERAKAALEGVSSGWVDCKNGWIGCSVDTCTCGGPIEFYGHEPGCGLEPMASGVGPEDANFIVTARSLVPELVAALEVSRKQSRAMLSQIGELEAALSESESYLAQEVRENNRLRGLPTKGEKP